MKTAADVRRARSLLDTVIMTETYESDCRDSAHADYPIVEFELQLAEEPKGDSRSHLQLDGCAEVPKDLAIETLAFLNRRAREELEKIGVKV
jgi:hypothetical protein